MLETWGSITGLGRSPGEGSSYPLQCSCWKNSLDCIVHGDTTERLSLSLFTDFLPRSKDISISWLQSPSTVNLELKKINSVTVSLVSLSICHEVMGPDAMMLIFWMLNFKPAFSFCSFTFIKRLFGSSLLSTIRVVLSEYLKLLIFLPAILISACASSRLAFCMMYSASKLNEQGDSLDVLLSQFWTSHLILYSVQFSHSVVSDSLWPDEPQHAKPSCSSPTPRVHPNLCPLSQWCHPTISSSVVPFFYIVLYWNKQNLSCSLTSFYLGTKLCIIQEYIGWTCSSPGTLKAAIYISTKMQIEITDPFLSEDLGKRWKKEPASTLLQETWTSSSEEFGK